MASITAPTSLQIRLAFTATNCCTKFPLLLHSRLRHVDRRPRLLCVAENGNGLDTTPSWVGSNGWPDSEVGKLSTKKNESRGGVGVAGLLLSGLTFSALFISRRRISTRQEQQMKPVTTHQEVLLLSDDHKDETAHLNAGNVVGQGNGTMEGQVDISMDYSSPY